MTEKGDQSARSC